MSIYKYTFKVLLLSHPTVKEEFINKYLKQIFSEDLSLTVGVEFYTKDVQFSGDTVRLQFWEISEGERFRFLIQSYCKGANGAVLMYDINNSKTLDLLIDYLQIISKNTGNIPIMLIGNKLYLEESREISREVGINIAEKYNLSTYTEISTKTGQNVENAFQILTEILINHLK